MNTYVDLGVVCQLYSSPDNAKSRLTFLMTFFFASSVKLDKNSASSAEIPWPGWSSRCITAASFSVILLVSVWMQTRCQVPSQVRSTSTPWGICRNATSNVKRMGRERKVLATPDSCSMAFLFREIRSRTNALPRSYGTPLSHLPQPIAGSQVGETESGSGNGKKAFGDVSSIEEYGKLNLPMSRESANH